MNRPWKAVFWTLLLTAALLLAMGVLRPAASATAAAAAPASFDDDFTPRTMRVDYYHSGTATEEHVALDRAVADGAWPGSRTQLVDPVNYGLYQFEVRDLESNRLLYSRGFSSVFGEWRTTPEAKQRWGTFHESLRFPWPKRAVQVALRVRGRDGLWREIWTAAIDPASRAVNKADLAPRGTVWSVRESGPPAQKVDLLILGDGYTASEMEKFRADARRLSGELFTVEPFRSRKSDFNVRAIDLPSSESGISRPHAGIFRRTPLGTHYSTFDSERYILTFDNRTLRDVAGAAPYDFLVILVNERTYGGGGIYNDQTTVAASNGFARYLFIHEFGHHFAALGDEYYTSDVAYETGAAEKPEPWEPNVTALHDPMKLKWRDLVTPGVPLPTPWNKEEFEKLSIANQEVRRKLRAEGAPEEKLEALFREEQEKMTKLLASSAHAGKIGAFEGAGYEAKGLYRPSTDCIMFTRDEVGFCAVCTRAIHRMMDAHTR
jgi:hypothetical protein